MPALVSRITRCLKCPQVQPPPYDGPCLCTADGRDILVHAAEGICPRGRYESLVPPARIVAGPKARCGGATEQVERAQARKAICQACPHRNNWRSPLTVRCLLRTSSPCESVSLLAGSCPDTPPRW